MSILAARSPVKSVRDQVEAPETRACAIPGLLPNGRVGKKRIGTHSFRRLRQGPHTWDSVPCATNLKWDTPDTLPSGEGLHTSDNP